MGVAPAAPLPRHVDEFARRLAGVRSVPELFAEASTRLRRLVRFDAAAWLATDPDTGLPTAPFHLDGVPDLGREACAEHWRREFLVDDVNLFRQLALASTPAAALRATLDDPTRSPRFRSFIEPLGYGDELRAVLRTGGAPWGTVTLWRATGAPPFDARDVDTVARVAPAVAEVLRLHSRPWDDAHAGDEPGARGNPGAPGEPGLLLFDQRAELRSLNDAARALLDALPDDGDRVAVGADVSLPLWLLVTVFPAVAGGRAGRPRVRARTREGGWLVCHTSRLDASDDDGGLVAVVLEPASPTDVATLVEQAYDLTAREQQIARLVARGADTAAMARLVHLSPHTVRDHVKAILAKVGVSSRGELVARLYTDVYDPVHAAASANTGD